jgi:hypothetical protein
VAAVTNHRDPKAELRQMVADKLLTRFLERARANVADSPEGHCADLADQVMELFTVEQDYSSVEVRAMGDRTEQAMWHRRLIAKTDWQSSTAHRAE